MDNYQYCVEWAKHAAGPNGRVLDYGCGSGQVVAQLRKCGVEAYGCDVFFDGGDFSDLREEAAPFIRRMESDRIPFDDASFDLVVSNQVLEHVPSLATVVSEIARVLKPAGQSLHIFPDRNVWLEPHTLVPFLHWLPRGKLRLWYASCVKALQGKKFSGGSYACNWIDNWTHFRRPREIHRTLGSRFDSIEHIETQWFDARFGGRGIPAVLKQWIVRRHAGMVVVLRRGN